MKRYNSQYGQDKFLNEIFFSKINDGIFLDIGAYDGITLSNSYFFEKYKNWGGVCVEPNPKIFSKLKVNRNCSLINACIHDESGIVIFQVIEGQGEMLSGIKATYDERHKIRINKTVEELGGNIVEIEVPSITISNLLENQSIDRVDFLSIDTEGNELNILKSFPFSKIKPKVIVVENNYNKSEIQSHLLDYGYIKCINLECDDIYCCTQYYTATLKMKILFYKVKRSLKYRISKLFYVIKNKGLIQNH